MALEAEGRIAPFAPIEEKRPSSHSMKHQSIQALRALAALMVLLHHSAMVVPEPDMKAALWWIPGFTDFGALGVNLFFVISGFIIATVVSRGSFSLADYIKKRFFRIYPLLWLAMILGLYHYRLQVVQLGVRTGDQDRSLGVAQKRRDLSSGAKTILATGMDAGA